MWRDDQHFFFFICSLQEAHYVDCFYWRFSLHDLVACFLRGNGFRIGFGCFLQYLYRCTKQLSHLVCTHHEYRALLDFLVKANSAVARHGLVAIGDAVKISLSFHGHNHDASSSSVHHFCDQVIASYSYSPEAYEFALYVHFGKVFIAYQA